MRYLKSYEVDPSYGDTAMNVEVLYTQDQEGERHEQGCHPSSDKQSLSLPDAYHDFFLSDCDIQSSNTKLEINGNTLYYEWLGSFGVILPEAEEYLSQLQQEPLTKHVQVLGKKRVSRFGGHFTKSRTGKQ